MLLCLIFAHCSELLSFISSTSHWKDTIRDGFIIRTSNYFHHRCNSPWNAQNGTMKAWQTTSLRLISSHCSWPVEYWGVTGESGGCEKDKRKMMVNKKNSAFSIVSEFEEKIKQVKCREPLVTHHSQLSHKFWMVFDLIQSQDHPH